MEGKLNTGANKSPHSNRPQLSPPFFGRPLGGPILRSTSLTPAVGELFSSPKMAAERARLKSCTDDAIMAHGIRHAEAKRRRKRRTSAALSHMHKMNSSPFFEVWFSVPQPRKTKPPKKGRKDLVWHLTRAATRLRSRLRRATARRAAPACLALGYCHAAPHRAPAL